MEYVEPFGEADPNAPYKDRNTGAGEPGSRVPAAAIEHPMREIMAVITAAGLTPDATDLTQLLQAIAQLIDSATGGGETSTYVLMAAARARLPVFPEIVSADGTFNLTIPATGTVRIPAGIELIHRGIFSVTTAQQDFATAANKTYHLRWNPTTGWALKDHADSGYNPSALAEADQSFDSSYDNMISHKIMTNGSNVATLTNLANRNRLSFEGAQIGLTSGFIATGSPAFGYAKDVLFSYNFARRPILLSPVAIVGNGGNDSPGTTQTANKISDLAYSRYSAAFRVSGDFDANVANPFCDARLWAVA